MKIIRYVETLRWRFGPRKSDKDELGAVQRGSTRKCSKGETRVRWLGSQTDPGLYIC